MKSQLGLKFPFQHTLKGFHNCIPAFVSGKSMPHQLLIHCCLNVWSGEVESFQNSMEENARSCATGKIENRGAGRCFFFRCDFGGIGRLRLLLFHLDPAGIKPGETGDHGGAIDCPLKLPAGKGLRMRYRSFGFVRSCFGN